MPPILYTCYHRQFRSGEQFIAEHVLSCQLAGQLTMNDGQKQYLFTEGSFRLSRRNTLVKFTKQPPAGGDYRNISVYLDQATLRSFSLESSYGEAGPFAGPSVISLAPNVLLRSYFASLQPYEQFGVAYGAPLQALKVKEAILVLLETDPALHQVLFDFREPGKIDLEAFMQRNFRFNVDLRRFAYLTGRSLATFKRDFGKSFGLPPGRWLVQRRLQEAHYQLTELGKAPVDVYFEVGFEDFSHFSFAFKKQYGRSPSQV